MTFSFFLAMLAAALSGALAAWAPALVSWGGSVRAPLEILVVLAWTTFSSRRGAAWVAWTAILLVEAARAGGLLAPPAASLEAAAPLMAAGAVALVVGRLKARLTRAALDMRALARRVDDFSEDGGAAAGTFHAAETHLAATMELCQRALGARTAALLKWNAGEGAFSIRAHASESPAFDSASTVPGDAFPMGAVRLSREPLVTAKERSAPAVLPYYPKEELVRSVAAAPVMEGDALVGILVADHPEAGAFTEGDKARLRDWAEHLARTLALWRGVAASEESARELRVLLDATQRLSPMLAPDEAARELLMLAEEIAPSDASAVCFFRSEEAAYRVTARQEGQFLSWEETKTKSSWARWIFENAEEHVSMGETGLEGGARRPSAAMPLYSLRESTERFRSFYGVPLRSAHGRMGVFAAGAFRPGAFTPRAARTLSVLAAHAAVVMEAAAMYKKMEDLSVTDGLTGLANNRRFREVLDGELRRAERAEAPLSLLMLDIDHFKKLNDTHGHPAGDAVLRRAAEILRRAVRDVDIPARYGGEEFAVILTDADATDAMRAAERVRVSIEDGAFEFGGVALRVTASVGAATYPTDARSAEALVAAADRALYAAKKAGRNRSVHARALDEQEGASV